VEEIRSSGLPFHNSQCYTQSVSLTQQGFVLTGFPTDYQERVVRESQNEHLPFQRAKSHRIYSLNEFCWYRSVYIVLSGLMQFTRWRFQFKRTGDMTKLQQVEEKCAQGCVAQNTRITFAFGSIGTTILNFLAGRYSKQLNIERRLMLVMLKLQIPSLKVGFAALS